MILNQTETRLQEIILEHTKLAKEFGEIYNQPNCEERLAEIKKRIENLRKERDELLFRLEDHEIL
jgi:hypothetical protein